MPTYRWTCHFCNATNEAGPDRCEKCGLPSDLSGEELALAKSDGSAAVVARREERNQKEAEWKAMPFSRKAATIFFVAVFLVGLVFVRFAPPFEYNLIGLALLAALFVILWGVDVVRRRNK